MSNVPSKKEVAYKRIRSAIISGELSPGEVMNEAEIAARFGSGKTPTREALLLLTHEAFLQSLPRVGYLVSKPTMEDILEAFHLRRILEVEAVGLAVNRMTPDQLGKLEENIREEEELANVPNGAQRERAIALNREFHLMIARLGGNGRLTRILQDLMDDMQRMLVTDPYLVEPSQHKGILSALRENDQQMAREAMGQHLEQTRSRVLNRY